MLTELDLPARDGVRDALIEGFTDLDNYALFDDVVPALDRLAAADVTLGVVSNFEAWLDDLLAALGVRDRFSVRVISGLDGVEKPEPRIYRLALERAGHPAERVAFVGDLPEFDVDPPAAIGMFPVLIDRRGRYPDHAGARIEDLRHLADVLEAA
jgi:putative hydrolase of the HAD superfamily